MPARDWTAAWAVVVIWAFNFIAAKAGVAQIPALFFLSLRFLLVAVLLAPFLRRPPPSWRYLLELALVLGGLHFGLLFVGLQGVDAGPAAVAIQLSIPFSAILARVVYGERLNTGQGVGLVLAFAGIYLVGGAPAAPVSGLHLAMVIAAAFAWAVSNILIKRLGSMNPFRLNAWFAVFTAPQLLAASVIFERGQFEALAAADWRGWGAVLYTAIGASIVAYGLWYRLLARHPVNRVVPLTLCAPVLAIAFAALLLGEAMTTSMVVGSALTLGGVAMVQFLKSRSAAPSPGA